MITFTIEAVYENGVLVPTRPLPLKDRDKVEITVHVGPSRAERTAGLLRWTGDPAVLRRVAEDDEFSIRESP